ncbi:MAG: Fic family protein [Chloroflexi bacterium]|nr:Fic family protein [Chloroflexota bacterium]
MDPNSFQAGSPGRVVQIGQAGLAYWAFVPAPLPPDLTPSYDLIRVLSEADRALGELAGLGRALPNPHLLIGPFVRREAVLSSRIEGTQADIADLYVYEAEQRRAPHPPAPPESDVQDVLNYVRAMEYGLTRLKELPMSLRLLRELHAELLHGVRGEQATPGEFRRTQNWIGKPGCTLSNASFVPPPVPEMLESLDGFEKYLHGGNRLPPLIRLALLHYQFETIHPFLDGNGRIGRLLVTLLLVHWNLLPLPLLYLSAFFESHRDEYYDRLFAVSQQAAWEAWILFFLRGVAEQARDATGRASRLQDLQRRWHDQLTHARGSALLFRLADSLFESPVLTIAQAQALLKVTYRSAQQNVQKLVDAEILRAVDESTYGKKFSAPAILEIIESPRS